MIVIHGTENGGMMEMSLDYVRNSNLLSKGQSFTGWLIIFSPQKLINAWFRYDDFNLLCLVRQPRKPTLLLYLLNLCFQYQCNCAVFKERGTCHFWCCMYFCMFFMFLWSGFWVSFNWGSFSWLCVNGDIFIYWDYLWKWLWLHGHPCWLTLFPILERAWCT